MKAISPVRAPRHQPCGDSVRCLSEHGLGISRGLKALVSGADEPLGLLYDMKNCYSKLKELVPSIPQGRKVSQMEILQHVIDYILDLQLALETHPAVVQKQQQQQQVQQQQLQQQLPAQMQHPAPSRLPLSALNTDVLRLDSQVSAEPGHVRNP
ncbi:DNA-binding protein inhibitor ID-2-like [Petromyzon marinus]|uniref:DNA-binding protein inhibitor ID-2-like n=1 Tax=Petromyzon marinus TaxID=7757 RepID=A0AAJ7TI97_PETMA|nr:DNA-binding protein inhibitor ID-2-like [Petromyzon marinus]